METPIRDTVSEDNPFELLTDFSDLHEISEELSSEDLINYFDSMPKVHVHQHEVTANENIHHFYKEQKHAEAEEDLDSLNESDMDEFEGLEEAILEKDIIGLRQTLGHVAKSVEPQLNTEEIDKFINDELNDEDLAAFEEELLQNGDLADELKLHQDIEGALKEEEVINLRRKVAQVMETETSWNVSAENIEDFIDGELEEDLLNEIYAELEENQDLVAEVELRRQLNEVAGEIDIHKLRSELQIAQKLTETNKVRRIVPEGVINRFTAFKSGVAVIVVLLGIASLMYSGYFSSNITYNKFYESPTWASERSVGTEITYLNKAQVAFMGNEFSKVIGMKENAPNAVASYPVFQFYSGASMQNLERFSEAISEYSKVIAHGDNIYVEEAKWYRSLCYMKVGKKDMAKAELLAIVNRNGFYKNDAKAVLRRLKITLK